MILTKQKKIHGKEGPIYIRFQRRKFAKLPDFDDKFQQVAKECRRILAKLFS
jgi:hypothetical protein